MRHPLRATLVTAAALAATVAAATPATAEEADPVDLFSGEFALGCRSAATEGTLHWETTPTPDQSPGSVNVAGVLTSNDDARCLRRGLLVFTAYTGMGQERVDYATVTADNVPDGLPFAFSLTNELGTSAAPIDLVQLQVCVDQGPNLPAFACGAPQFFTTTDLEPTD
ncbi:hypothetical protein ACTWP5_03170 [Streptomyces sp. 4N509B]|uniref:hypothetical protein n=1 Tax=Streptomyces sp. 4N509B TaxID=3457413 RepID=UPI003FCFE656